jgi:hypothetical protein
VEAKRNEQGSDVDQAFVNVAYYGLKEREAEAEQVKRDDEGSDVDKAFSNASGLKRRLRLSRPSVMGKALTLTKHFTTLRTTDSKRGRLRLSESGVMIKVSMLTFRLSTSCIGYWRKRGRDQGMDEHVGHEKDLKLAAR